MSRYAKPSNGMPQVQDRRAHSRVSVSLPCEIHSGNQIYRGTLVHLSLSGAFISSLHTPAPGERITVVVPTRAGSGSLSLAGQVVRSGYHHSNQGGTRGFGVRFQRAGTELLALIKHAMSTPGLVPGPVAARDWRS